MKRASGQSGFRAAAAAVLLAAGLSRTAECAAIPPIVLSDESTGLRLVSAPDTIALPVGHTVVLPVEVRVLRRPITIEAQPFIHTFVNGLTQPGPKEGNFLHAVTLGSSSAGLRLQTLRLREHNLRLRFSAAAESVTVTISLAPFRERHAPVFGLRLASFYGALAPPFAPIYGPSCDGCPTSPGDLPGTTRDRACFARVADPCRCRRYSIDYDPVKDASQRERAPALQAASTQVLREDFSWALTQLEPHDAARPEPFSWGLLDWMLAYPNPQTGEYTPLSPEELDYSVVPSGIMNAPWWTACPEWRNPNQSSGFHDLENSRLVSEYTGYVRGLNLRYSGRLRFLEMANEPAGKYALCPCLDPNWSSEPCTAPSGANQPSCLLGADSVEFRDAYAPILHASADIAAREAAASNPEALVITGAIDMPPFIPGLTVTTRELITRGLLRVHANVAIGIHQYPAFTPPPWIRRGDGPSAPCRNATDWDGAEAGALLNCRYGQSSTDENWLPCGCETAPPLSGTWQLPTGKLLTARDLWQLQDQRVDLSPLLLDAARLGVLDQDARRNRFYMFDTELHAGFGSDPTSTPAREALSGLRIGAINAHQWVVGTEFILPADGSAGSSTLEAYNSLVKHLTGAAPYYRDEWGSPLVGAKYAGLVTKLFTRGNEDILAVWSNAAEPRMLVLNTALDARFTDVRLTRIAAGGDGNGARTSVERFSVPPSGINVSPLSEFYFLSVTSDRPGFSWLSNLAEGSGCVPPSSPRITSAPEDQVVAGNPFTIAWGGDLARSPTGFYSVDVSTRDDCSSPVTVASVEPIVTIPTETGRTGVYCVFVRAVSGPGCESQRTGPLKVATRVPPARFAIVRQARPVIMNAGETPPEDVEAAIRNIGGVPGGLMLSGEPGFFVPDSVHVPAVPPGGDVKVRLRFDSRILSEPGTHSGSLRVAWDGGFLLAPVSLTTLGGPASGADGSKLSFSGIDELHFRQAGAGNPVPQDLVIVNTGSAPARLAPMIGPRGSWLSVAGDFATPLAPGESRRVELGVDRSKRVETDGPPPLMTSFKAGASGGKPENAAFCRVFDEEPAQPSPAAGRPPLAPGERSLILGSAVHAPGGGATFVSDGWFANTGASQLTATLYWTPNGVDGLQGETLLKGDVTMGPYSSFRLADMVKGFFGVEGLSGHVEIRSNRLSQLSFRSTADAIVPRGGGVARYGAEIPIAISGQGARKTLPSGASGGEVDAVAVIVGLRDSSSGFRTNVILAETSGHEAAVAISLFDREGIKAGEKRALILPWSKQQINAGHFELSPMNAVFDGGSAIIRVESGEGHVTALATVIDDRSSSFSALGPEVFLTDASGRAESRAGWKPVEGPAFLPGAVHSEAVGGSFYATRLALGNAGSRAVELVLQYLPEPGLGDPIQREVTLPAGKDGPGVIVFDDVLAKLFGVTGNSRGMIRFDGDFSTVCVTSETWTPVDASDPGRGRSLSALNPGPGRREGEVRGLFTPASDEVIGTLASGSPRGAASLPFAEESPAFRTNLILAELSGQPIEIRIRLLDRSSNGVALGEKTFALGPFERMQSDRIIRQILDVPFDDPWFDLHGVAIQAVAAGGSGRAVAMVTRIANDPESKRADVLTLGTAAVPRTP